MSRFELFPPPPPEDFSDKTQVTPASARARESFDLCPLQPERDDLVEILLPLSPEVGSDVDWWCGQPGERRGGDYLRRGMVVG